jgi:hypothetical protein
VAVAAVIALALAAPGFSAPAKTKATKSHTVVGTLEKVDGQNITVHTAKGSETVMLMTSSRINRGAEKIQPANLSTYAGQRVKLRYVENNGQKQAETVSLASAPKAATAKPAAQASKTASKTQPK